MKAKTIIFVIVLIDMILGGCLAATYIQASGGSDRLATIAGIITGLLVGIIFATLAKKFFPVTASKTTYFPRR